MAQGMKSWAFRSPLGQDKVTARAIAKERLTMFEGAPTGDIYFSTHKPGRRKRMKHVMKSGTPFFAYIESNDGKSSDGGESLTHRLFKEAIAGLKTTNLHLGASGDHAIQIRASQIEKRFPCANEYYADVFITFECATSLGMKWAGELYIEIHHTNAVSASKQNDLRAARIPVVEVDVPNLFFYPYDDTNTTDERETMHIAKLQRMMENGFLKGRVISNPCSVEYLEDQLASATSELNAANVKAQQIAQEAAAREQATQAQILTASQRFDELCSKVRAIEGHNRDLLRQLSASHSEIERQAQVNTKLNNTVQRANERADAYKRWVMGLAILLCLAIILMMTLLFGR